MATQQRDRTHDGLLPNPCDKFFKLFIGRPHHHTPSQWTKQVDGDEAGPQISAGLEADGQLGSSI
jgi:hypothetical protein